MSETLDPDQDARLGLDLTDCDREPIHIPGSIQPHGLLLVVERAGRRVVAGAGRIEALTGVEAWIGADLSDILGEEADRRLVALPAHGGYAGRWRSRERLEYDIVVHGQDDRWLIEVEQSSQAAYLGVELLARLDAAGLALEHAPTVKALCDRAAEEFRRLTGFDRIMIYRFLDDDAGQVLAESRAEGQSSFLNQHFPASDIPRQARALYVRNTVRVIPDIGYQPQPLRPASPDDQPLDMSDCGLRSVSPVHIQYLKNMGVGASASVSIVVDGELWGLVACHNDRPQLLPYEIRMAATALSRAFARQLKAKAETEAYRERIRLRGMEDELIGLLPSDMPLASGLGRRMRNVTRLLAADGSAVVRAGQVVADSVTPSDEAILGLARWLQERGDMRPVASSNLARLYAPAEAYMREASGLLAIVVPSEEPLVLMWFRAEHIETVRWAGDPHGAVKEGPAGQLTPRASFDSWAETVRGQARRWTLPEIEAAGRLRDALTEVEGVHRLQTTNQILLSSVTAQESRLAQKDYLLREVSHRVQNSLQLISSFLALQAREHGDGPAATTLQEARRRIRAVSLVHSRLYQADHAETIDLSRYIAELVEELTESMGPDWREAVTLDLAPASIVGGRAVTLGLILTELLINAQKYAYGGAPGAIDVSLSEDRANLRLTVRDHGKGGDAAPSVSSGGFGSRMIDELARQLGGRMEQGPAAPGWSSRLTFPADGSR